MGELHGLGDVDPHELYEAMDWLVERQAAIEQRLAKRHLREHTLVLYDLTSSYVGISVKWNSGSGDLEHGFRRSGMLVGA